MKIIHFYNPEDYRQKEINRALKKTSNEIVDFDEADFDIGKLIEEPCDVLLFHNGGIIGDTNLNLSLTMERLKKILTEKDCKKVFWYLELVIGMREMILEQIVPLVTTTFLNDETWIRRHVFEGEKVYPLHLATGIMQGKFRKELETDIAFIGDVYGIRQDIIDILKQGFKNQFRLFRWDEKIFGDICRSAKIVFIPKFPFTDFYWGDDVYNAMGSGGLVLAPKLYGLQQELQDEQEIIFYGNVNELLQKATALLKMDKQRKEVSAQGQKAILAKHTYDIRVKELLEKI